MKRNRRSGLVLTYELAFKKQEIRIGPNEPDAYELACKGTGDQDWS
jgi:hypothetical protein